MIIQTILFGTTILYYVPKFTISTFYSLYLYMYQKKELNLEDIEFRLVKIEKLLQENLYKQLETTDINIKSRKTMN